MAMEALEGRGGSVKLFGVMIGAGRAEEEEEMEARDGDGDGVGEEVLRKSLSMGNLSSAEHGAGGELGYLSDGGLVKSGRHRRGAGATGHERKKGVPWTEVEHRTFLAGLEKLGKGDWRGISRKFVTTRTPTQVASHAQKYFIRQTMPNNKKRRSSLFDVVINDTVQASTAENASELPLAKSNDKPNDTNPTCQANENEGKSALDSTKTASKVSEIPPNLQLPANHRGISEPCSLNIMVGVSGFTEEEKQKRFEPNISPTLPLMFSLPQSPDTVSSKVNPHPTGFNPEFLQLFPSQASATYPVNENSDLELRALDMINAAPSEWSWCH